MFLRKKFLSKPQLDELVAAIRLAESETSGEIRIFYEKRSKGDVIARATKMFHKMKMDKTILRNGVLIYIAYADHQFAFIGDEAIYKNVSHNFWNEVIEKMKPLFTEGKFVEGMKYAIERAGEILQKHFPAGANNMNELSDEIVDG